MIKDLWPSKSCWHPLSLQQLAPNRFVRVVNNILKGRDTLVRLAPPRTETEGRKEQ